MLRQRIRADSGRQNPIGPDSPFTAHLQWVPGLLWVPGGNPLVAPE